MFMVLMVFMTLMMVMALAFLLAMTLMVFVAFMNPMAFMLILISMIIMMALVLFFLDDERKIGEGGGSQSVLSSYRSAHPYGFHGQRPERLCPVGQGPPSGKRRSSLPH